MKLYCFDFDGAYLGSLEPTGEFRDAHGRQWGRLVDENRIHGLDGRYRARIDAQGSLFDATGHCFGYVRDWTCAPEIIHGCPPMATEGHRGEPLRAPSV